jgi:hypothetical protein
VRRCDSAYVLEPKTLQGNFIFLHFDSTAKEDMHVAVCILQDAVVRDSVSSDQTGLFKVACMVDTEFGWDACFCVHACLSEITILPFGPFCVFSCDVMLIIYIYINVSSHCHGECRDSLVCIATRYRLEGPRIESRWGARYSAPFQTGPGVHSASYAMGTGSFPGVKVPGRGFDHPPHLVTKLKKENSYTSTSPLSLRSLL